MAEGTEIGSLSDHENLKDLFDSPKAAKVFQSTRSSEDVWLLCNTRDQMKKHGLSVLSWILYNKFRPGGFRPPPLRHGKGMERARELDSRRGGEVQRRR